MSVDIRLLPGLTPYEDAWRLQQELHAEVVSGADNTVLLLQHPPVFTAGKRTQPEDRPWDGTPVIDVDRGGRITWHGPGQIVGYPILRLPDPIDVVAHVRRLEDVLIATCAELGIEGIRVEGRSGVWVDSERPRKIAAIGVRVARGVTMHGFALNVDCDMTWFSRIVPCGITDAGVTSASEELGRHVGVEEVLPILEMNLQTSLGTIGAPRSTMPADRVSGAS